MNRREMLKYTALLTGAVVSTPFATAFLSGCSQEHKSADANLLFFEPDPFELLTQLVDTVLPRTDSPSASDVNVHQTIDSMLGQVFNEEFISTFRKQWDALETFLSDQNFRQLQQADRAELLRELELSSSDHNATASLAFKELKQQTIAYYLSTEEIGKEYLNYLPIPGEYKPCIPVEEVNNKLWAIRI